MADKMNLSKFLNQVDALAEQCDREQLVSFVHEMARVLPEEKRETFILRLEAMVQNKKMESVLKILRNRKKKICRSSVMFFWHR